MSSGVRGTLLPSAYLFDHCAAAAVAVLVVAAVTSRSLVLFLLRCTYYFSGFET